MRPLPLALALLAVASFSHAQSDPCKTLSSTLEINQCGAITLKAKDRELNEAYQALLKSLKPEDKSDETDFADVKRRLVEAQRGWIVFRDNDCKAKMAYWSPGTIRGAMYLACLTERTEQRTKELRVWTQ